MGQFFSNVNEQLADPTSIQSLSYDSKAVEATNLESNAKLFVLHSVLFIFAL